MKKLKMKCSMKNLCLIDCIQNLYMDLTDKCKVKLVLTYFDWYIVTWAKSYIKYHFRYMAKLNKQILKLKPKPSLKMAKSMGKWRRVWKNDFYLAVWPYQRLSNFYEKCVINKSWSGWYVFLQIFGKFTRYTWKSSQFERNSGVVPLIRKTIIYYNNSSTS